MSTIKANRWAWILAGTALSGGGLVLAFLLVMATQNSERLEPYFAWLVWGNLAVATVLGLTIAIALGRLALRLRARKFGSRLLLKLAGIFGLVGLLPGLLIYTVSYQFVSRLIGEQVQKFGPRCSCRTCCTPSRPSSASSGSSAR
jgi:nitrogen fixation/metabolism regulation signal transduction histidine kinase